MGVFRTFLALAVASSHTGLNIIGIMPFGALAVRSFFMVSGFYMYMILDTKYLKLPDGTRLFYTNRMWRLYPSYLVVLILSFLAMVVTGTTTMRIWSLPASEFWSALATLRPSSLFLIIMSNVFMVFANYVITAKYVPDGSLIDGIGAPGAQPCHYLLLNPPVWTLGVELAFYVMVPFLVRFGLGMTVWRRNRLALLPTANVVGCGYLAAGGVVSQVVVDSRPAQLFCRWHAGVSNLQGDGQSGFCPSPGVCGHGPARFRHGGVLLLDSGVSGR